MKLPHRTLQSAFDHAQFKANETRRTWYVNRLASSGMCYEASDTPITDTSFGGGLVKTVEPEPGTDAKLGTSDAGDEVSK